MALVWVTGNSGAGKSTAAETLRRLGYTALDADEDGYSRWVTRSTHKVVFDPPDPVPPGWLTECGWEIDAIAVGDLARRAHDSIVFLCGSAENEATVRDLFDLVVCIVIDETTLRSRLATRTNNAFGQNPEELEAALYWNDRTERAYRRMGAVIVDGVQEPDKVAKDILSACLTMRSR